MDDVISGDHVAGDWEASISQSCNRQRAGCRGDDGKAVRRQMGKQFCRTRQGSHTLFVIDFHLLDQNIFFFGV